MGKKAERNTLQHQGVSIEQTSVYDDSLLPPSEELAKLKELDPGSIDWIKRRTEIEQDARIRFNDERLRLLEKDMNQALIQNVLLVSCAFLIIVLVISCAAWFVYKGLNVEGTIFGGSSILLAAFLFIRWRKGSDT